MLKLTNPRASWRVFSWSASIGSFIVDIPSDPSTFCGSSFSNQENIKAIPSTVASIALPKHFGNFAGSCGTLAMTPISWAEMKWMRKH
jgi:hypothetical protein